MARAAIEQALFEGFGKTFAAKLWKPRVFQKRAVKWLISRGAALLFLDPGLGKTSVVLAAFLLLRRQKLATRMLVIAPRRVMHNVWPAEVAKWIDFADLDVAILHGPRKDAERKRDADIYVINPEGLAWFFRDAVHARRWLRTKGVDVLVVDEITKFKNSRAQRCRLLRPFLPLFSRRWGLTGTPAPNGLLDLFGQVYVVDLGRSLGQYFSHYRLKYFDPQDAEGWAWMIQEGAEKRIRERLKPLALRMSASEYLRLPPITFTTLGVDLPCAARRQYDEMENALFSRIEKKLVHAGNAAAASTKCRQIASGAVYYEERQVVDVHDAKLVELQELVESLQGAPAFVAYEFRQEVPRIQAALGKLSAVKAYPPVAGVGDRVPHVGGGVSDRRTSAILHAWNQRQLPILLAHPDSLGHGVNLQDGGNHVIFFSTTWNLELYEQFFRRVWRFGTKGPVFVYHIVARDTVDEVVLTAIGRKGRTQKALLDGLRARATKRARRKR